MARRSLIPVLAVALLPACMTTEHAEVVVDATDGVREATRSIELLVIAQPEREVVFNQVLDLPAEAVLPLRLVLVPDHPGGDDRFHVIARAYGGPGGTGDVVARQLLLGGYAPGEVVEYRMVLGLEEER